MHFLFANRILSTSLLGALAGLALMLSGCGDGTQRVRVSGQVTFEGKLVPYGNIVFEPDQSKGNRGPQGFAKIHDGMFDTNNAGTGPCPGPQIVTIEGYPELNSIAGKKSMLVFRYQTTVDLPAQTTTESFEVPASAAQREAVSDLPPP